MLLIEIGDSQVINRIRCLNCLSCGLGANGELLEIWVQELAIKREK